MDHSPVPNRGGGVGGGGPLGAPNRFGGVGGTFDAECEALNGALPIRGAEDGDGAKPAAPVFFKVGIPPANSPPNGGPPPPPPPPPPLLPPLVIGPPPRDEPADDEDDGFSMAGFDLSTVTVFFRPPLNPVILLSNAPLPAPPDGGAADGVTLGAIGAIGAGGGPGGIGGADGGPDGGGAGAGGAWGGIGG